MDSNSQQHCGGGSRSSTMKLVLEIRVSEFGGWSSEVQLEFRVRLRTIRVSSLSLSFCLSLSHVFICMYVLDDVDFSYDE